MNSILENLVKTLPKDKFKYLYQEFCGKRLELVKQKGIYPYEYMNSFKKIHEIKLPKKEDFYSLLRGEYVIDKDYEHAKKFGINLK